MRRNQNPSSITVRMPTVMQRKLRKMSDDVDRSRNWLILQALNLYIQVYEEKQTVESATYNDDHNRHLLIPQSLRL